MGTGLLSSLLSLLLILPTSDAGFGFNYGLAAATLGRTKKLTEILWHTVWVAHANHHPHQTITVSSAFPSPFIIHRLNPAVASFSTGPSSPVSSTGEVSLNATQAVLWPLFKPLRLFEAEDRVPIDMVYVGFPNGGFVGYAA